MRHGGVSDITAVVLAGGLGTRLRPVVADRPKVLAEVRGRPFLFYLFDQLLDARVNRAVLCTGHLGDRIEEAVGNAYRSLAVGYSRESSPLGTAGAVRNALPHLEGERVLVLNGDSYCDTSVAAFWEWHLSKGAQGTLLLAAVPDTRRYGKVETDAEGRILRFCEKGTDAGAGLVNAGIYAVSKQLIFSIPCGRRASLEQEMFPQWIGKGLYGCSSGGRFIDIGTPGDFERAASFFEGYEQ
jgi:NDP-sugar pyrophosphorylase family protein